MRGISFLRLILCVMVCLQLIFCLVCGQETYTDDQLEAMSDDELEMICTVRGFQLMKDQIDESTGEKYEITHTDYVEAAKQCLAIEKEMNDLLEEYPELREELEEELEKMQAEQAAKKAELESLQQQLLEKESSTAESSDHATTGAAFVPKSKTVDDSETQDKGDSNSSLGTGHVKNDLGEVSDESTEENVAEGGVSDNQTIEESPVDDGSLEISEEEPIQQETDANMVDETEDLDYDSSMDSGSPSEGSGSVATTNDESKSDDLTLAYLQKEFLKYVRKDIEKIMKLVLPVIQPMVNAGNVAWKYIRATIMTIQRTYEEQNQKQEGENAAATS